MTSRSRSANSKVTFPRIGPARRRLRTLDDRPNAARRPATGRAQASLVACRGIPRDVRRARRSYVVRPPTVPITIEEGRGLHAPPRQPWRRPPPRTVGGRDGGRARRPSLVSGGLRATAGVATWSVEIGRQAGVRVVRRQTALPVARRLFKHLLKWLAISPWRTRSEPSRTPAAARCSSSSGTP